MTKQNINKKLVKKDTIKNRKIESYIKKNKLIIALVNFNILNNKKTIAYSGYYILIVGYKNNNIVYHESGPRSPQAFKEIRYKRFLKTADIGGKKESIIICSK